MPPGGWVEGEQVRLRPGDRCRLQGLGHAACAKLNGDTVMVLGHVECGYGDERERWVVRWDGTEQLFRVQRRHLVRMHPDTSIEADATPESRRMPPPPAVHLFAWGARPRKLEGVADHTIVAGACFANELKRSNPIW